MFPTMSSRKPLSVVPPLLVGLATIALGLWVDRWGILAPGVGLLAVAAWNATEPS